MQYIFSYGVLMGKTLGKTMSRLSPLSVITISHTPSLIVSPSPSNKIEIEFNISFDLYLEFDLEFELTCTI